jgi:hypothetical protein
MMGFVNAIRFFAHVVPKAFIGPGTTASTDFSVFTDSTFPFIAIRVPEIEKDRGVVPDLFERLFPHSSTVQFQIATGLNLTRMGEEAEGDPSQTTPGHGIQSVLLRCDLLPLFLGPLAEDPVIMWGTGGLQLERNPFPLLVKPVERFFIVEGGDLLILKLLSPSGGNQEEDVMGYRTKVNRKFEDVGDQMEVHLGDGRVDLEFKTSPLGQFNPLQGTLKGSFHLSKGIMGL